MPVAEIHHSVLLKLYMLLMKCFPGDEESSGVEMVPM
jgi:hypothetical protein